MDYHLIFYTTSGFQLALNVETETSAKDFVFQYPCLCGFLYVFEVVIFLKGTPTCWPSGRGRQILGYNLLVFSGNYYAIDFHKSPWTTRNITVPKHHDPKPCLTVGIRCISLYALLFVSPNVMCITKKFNFCLIRPHQMIPFVVPVTFCKVQVLHFVARS